MAIARVPQPSHWLNRSAAIADTLRCGPPRLLWSLK